MNTRIAIGLLGLLASFFSVSAFAAYGRTAGQFAVSPLGAAEYSIPVWAPPGIHGVQPKLSLAYDSHESYGLMGPGWALGGLSSITRCIRTYAQDGSPAPITLTSADGLCLDGNRLRTTSTGMYQTEIANFSQITANGTAGNGPSYFTVQGKDGLTYEYGNTTDSKIISSGSTTPYIWALNKVTDRSGNYMTYTYFQSGGSYVPLSIQYTAASGTTSFPYTINFTYTTKTSNDTLTRYIAGSQVQQTNQLSTITVTHSGTTLRVYKLLYTTSTATLRATLTSIQECGGSAGTDCLSATTVGYQNGAAGIASPVTASGSGATNGAVYSVDIDGDGKQDLVFAVSSGSNYQWWVQMATSSGYGVPINSGAVTVGTANFLLDNFDGHGGNEIIAPVGGTWYAYKWNGASQSFTSTSTGVSVIAGTNYVSADVNGDGLPDLVNVSVAASPVASVNVGIQLNTGNGSGISFASTPVVNNVSVGVAGTANFHLLGVFGNNLIRNTSAKYMDFDGDNRQDILLSTYEFQNLTQVFVLVPLLSRGTGSPAIGPYLASRSTPIASFAPLHWNDDSCTDLMLNGYIQLSPCNGSPPEYVVLPNTAAIALDWDGDGRTDVLANVSGTWQVFRSEGYTSAAGVSTGIAVGSGAYVVTDQNGDGLDDLIFANSTASYAVTYGLHNGSGTRPDLATSFTDGYGVTATPTYVSLAQANPTTYYFGTGIVYPQFAYDGPLYVASAVGATDGIGGTYTTSYLYQTAEVDLQGRGFQGFAGVQSSDSRTGLSHIRAFNTVFPNTGMSVADVDFETVSGQFLEYTANTLTSLTLDATAKNQRYFPYASSTAKYTYELPGAMGNPLITTSVTNFSSPDSYGNFASVSNTLTDTDATSPYYNEQWASTTASSYTPDTSTWCVSLPTQIQIINSSTASGGASLTRTVSFVPDYANCRQTEQVVEPSSPQYKVTIGYGYDGFGNLNSETVTGASMASRTTTLNWGATGQFLTTMTNALSQTTTFAFDSSNGKLVSLKDANNITTSWHYDNFARKDTESRPDGTSTTWAYSNCVTAGCVNTNNKMTVTQTIKNVGGGIQSVTNDYQDWFERSLITSRTMLNGAFDRNEVQYDNVGNVNQQSAPCTFVGCVLFWTINSFDVRNRLTQTQRPISSTNSSLETTLYTYAGRTSTITDALNHASTHIAHVNGALGRSQDASGYYQEFTYDAFGSLLKAADKPGNALFSASYGYGVSAFQIASSDMDAGNRFFTIDALGEMTSYTDAKSQNFSISYDALSRPLVRIEPDLTTTWTWGATASLHNIGQLQSVSATGSGTFSESYTFDTYGRPSTKTLVLPSDATYLYTAAYNTTTGLLDTLQYPASTSYQLKLQYGYANGILNTIKDFNAPSTVFWTANNTNPRGQITQETLGNGAVVSHVYDAVTSWLGSVQASPAGGATLQNYGFLFDYVGNVTQRQNSNLGLTENFYYDAMNRLDHSTLGGITNLQMNYDTAGMGNIASRSDVAGGAAWTYDPTRKHAVTQAGSGAFTYTYDLNGNAMTRNGDIVSWTSYNYPSGINSGGESVQFWYGPERQRWKTVYAGSTTETTYHVDKLLEKVAGGGTIDYRHYIYAGSELVGIYSRTSAGTNTMRYVLSDQQGSFTNIDTGTSPATNYVSENFTAYGNRRNGSTWSGAPTTADENAVNAVSRRGYTGETVLGVSMGLNHLNGRVEDAITGRFLSPDPFIPDARNTQSLNRYSYINNNPLSFLDPTGFDETGLPELIVTAGGGPEDVYTDVAAGIVEILSDLGLAGLFGGGGPTLTPAQQAFENHGGDLKAPLPQVQVTAARFADNSIAAQFYSPFTTSAIASVLGVEPSQVTTRVTVTPSQSPDQLDQINVYASGSHAFNWFNLVPGWAALNCVYFGCGSGDWTLAAIGAIPFGSAESAVVRGGLAPVRAGQLGENAVRAARSIGPKTAIDVAGRTRVPDGLLSDALSEVKNVGYLSYSQQLQDFAQYAAQNGLRFDLYVRASTVLSGPLQEAISSGAINLLFIPGL